MSILQRLISEIEDDEIIQMLDELGEVSRLDIHRWQGNQLLKFLQQVLVPNGGAEKPIPITREDLDEVDPLDSFLLRKKIGKVGDGVYEICNELAALQRKGIESSHCQTLYVFLNRNLIPKKSKKKPYRWAQS